LAEYSSESTLSTGNASGWVSIGPLSLDITVIEQEGVSIAYHPAVVEQRGEQDFVNTCVSAVSDKYVYLIQLDTVEMEEAGSPLDYEIILEHLRILK
jgi:hypothetical protein